MNERADAGMLAAVGCWRKLPDMLLMQLSLEVIFDSENRNESPVLAGMRECLTG
jgi:hypothetical protein